MGSFQDGPECQNGAGRLWVRMESPKGAIYVIDLKGESLLQPTPRTQGREPSYM